jgi:hypothetical protein
VLGGWGEGSAGVEILVDGMKRTGGSLKDKEARGWSKAVEHRGGSMDNTRALRGSERA